jgi:hypothetical protein
LFVGHIQVKKPGFQRLCAAIGIDAIEIQSGVQAGYGGTAVGFRVFQLVCPVQIVGGKAVPKTGLDEPPAGETLPVKSGQKIEASAGCAGITIKIDQFGVQLEGGATTPKGLVHPECYARDPAVRFILR